MTSSAESAPLAEAGRLRVARFLLIAVAGLGALVLAEWAVDGSRLAALPRAEVTMAPTTAVLLIVLAAARLGYGGAPRVRTAELGGAVVLIAALTFIVMEVAGFVPDPAPNFLMSPVTALALILLGFATMTTYAGPAALRTAGAVAAVLAALLSVTVAVGYGLRAPLMYGAGVPMARLASVGVALQALALILALNSQTWPLSQFVVERSISEGATSTAGAVALGAVIGAAVIAAASVYLVSSRRELRQDAVEDLTAAADVKRSEVARWFRERTGDARTLHESRTAAGLVGELLASGPSPAAESAVHAWATSLRTSYAYSAVVVYDADAKVRLEDGAPSTPIRPEAITRAIRAGTVMLDDIAADDPAGRRQLAFLAPVVLIGGAAERAAVVALIVDARTELYPMLVRWPFRSAQAETLLARREGNEIVYLTDLRLPNSESSRLLRVPLSRTDIALVNVVRGATGPFEGIDYLGNRVMASGGPVPGTPWVLVVKQDASEVYAPFWREVRLASAFGLLLILTTSFALVTSTRQQALRTLQARMAVDRERQDSDERLRSAMAASLDAFVILDASGRIVEWNQQAERTFSWPRHEAIGQSFTALALAEPLASEYETAFDAARLGIPSARLNARVAAFARKRDGTSFPAELTVTAVRLSRALAFSAVVRDITDRVRAEQDVANAQGESERLLREAEAARRALLNIVDDQRITEQALRETENLLESRVAHRTMQLEAANRELEAFSYSVSHDLRAPLRAIAGYARMIEEDYAGLLDEEGRRRLDVVQREARRMGTLIDDLLRFSRLGRQPLERAPVDMAEMVREVYAELSREFDGRTVSLSVGDLPPAVGDAGVLRQVWTNLIGNALKFTATREITTIAIDASVTATEHTYSIADNGVGFDMRYADKLFGVFQRLHSQAEFEGTGVGLALSQRIIARHGGRIWAEGEPGRGATFHFTLPHGPADQAV